MIAQADLAGTLAERASCDLDGSFAEIVAAYGPAVYTTVLRVSQQPADAEDLAAEAFLRAYKALRRYSSERIALLQLRPWLITIALNLWRNKLRDASRRPSEVPLHPDVLLSDGAGGPEQVAVESDASAELELLLHTLPYVPRTAIVLRHVVGLSYGEISDVLDVPAGTVKSHVSRGLKALRLELRGDETRALEKEAMP